MIKDSEFSVAPVPSGLACTSGLEVWIKTMVSGNAEDTGSRAKRADFWLCPSGAVTLDKGLHFPSEKWRHSVPTGWSHDQHLMPESE